MKKKEAAMPKPDEEWEAEQDMRDLMRAEEIKADKNRMAKVHKHIKGHKRKIRSIEDLKQVANNFEKESAAEERMEGGKEE